VLLVLQWNLDKIFLNKFEVIFKLYNWFLILIDPSSKDLYHLSWLILIELSLINNSINILIFNNLIPSSFKPLIFMIDLLSIVFNA
jgi:hypothetical protein